MADTDERGQPGPKPLSSITVFAIKTAIVAVACVVSLNMIASYVDDIVESRIEQIRQAGAFGRIGGREFWTGLERQLEEQADPKRDLSPERRQKILTEIRIISDRWRPFIMEALGQRTDAGEQAPASTPPH